MFRRPCPLCGSNDSETIIELEAEEFCRSNWSYRSDFRSILDMGSSALFPIVRCRACSMVFASLLPPPDFLAALYDQVIQKEQCVAGSENRSSYARRLRYVAELLDLAPAGDPIRALDFGSGLGITLRILRACEVDGIGFDPSAVRTTYSRESNVVIVADLEELRRRAPYAVIVLDNVLEHIPDPTLTMSLLREVSAKDAVAYVSVPPYEKAFLQREVERQRRGEALDMTLNPWEHLNYFSLKHLDALMLRGGFRRLTAVERTGAPVIGLRPEKSRGARLKNVIASVLRLASYATRGDVLATAEHAFYRRLP